MLKRFLRRTFRQGWTVRGLLWTVIKGLLLGHSFITQPTNFTTRAYLHSGKTHQTYKIHPLLEWYFRIQIWISTGIKPWFWARVHRYHHRYTELPQDGHSPLFKGGISGVALHNPALYQASGESPEVIAAVGDDFKPDRWDELIFNHSTAGLAVGSTISVVAFGFFPAAVAMTSHVYIYIILNALINSLGHGAERTGEEGWFESFLFWVCQKTGSRPGYDPATAKVRQVGNSLNLNWLALITMGEGNHYNHHFNPRSPTMRRFRGDHDPGIIGIRILARLGLITELEIPTLEERPERELVAA